MTTPLDNCQRAAELTPRATDFLLALGGAEAPTGVDSVDVRRKEVDRVLSTDEFDTKERITLAAVEMVLKDGIHFATVDSIAARARVSKGSVFYSFGSREKLIRHVMDTLVDVLSFTVASARDGLHGVDALESVFRSVLTLTVRNHASVHTVFSEITCPESPWNFAQDALVEGVNRPIMEILREIGPTRAVGDDSRTDFGDGEEAGVQRMRITVAAIIGALFLVGQTLASDHADAAMIDAATAQLVAIAQK